MTRPSRFLSSLALGAVLLAAGAAGVFAQATRPSTGPEIIVPKNKDPNQTISFSFQQADIDDVLRFLAEATGKIIFKDSSVSTTITIRNQSRLPVAQAIRLIQELLSLKGYSLIESPEFIVVTTSTTATLRSSEVSVGHELASVPNVSGVITHIFPLQSVDATRLVQELTPLFPVGSGAVLIADGDSNSVIMTAEASNVRRVARIVEQVDRSLTDEIQVEVIHLMFADATEVARYLTDLFQPPTQNQGGGGFGGGGGGFPGFGGGAPGGGGAGGAARAAPSGLQTLRGRVRFAADTRSNNLLVYATPANIKVVKDLVQRIDVNLSPRVEFRIVPLKYADASAMADQLNQLQQMSATTTNRPGGGGGGFFGGGFFGGGGGNRNNNASTQPGDEFYAVPDVRTNSLIVTAPVDRAQSVEDLIRKLDVPSQVEDVVRVFQLKNAIASETATTLRNLFQGVTGQQGGLGINLFGQGQRTTIPPNSPLDLLRQVTIVANDQTNQLLISGPSQTFPVIEQLLREDGEGLDRRLPQVFIEVVIADVTLDDEFKFGIEWNATSGTSTFGQNFGLTSPTADNTGFRYSIVSGNYQATLTALRATNRLKVISTPHVLVTDNSPALVSIGESIPYAGDTTVTNGAVTTSTQFQDVAITLNVTPHISPGGHILMDIDQVVNSLIEFITVAPGQTAPRTTSRRAGTTVIVQNDQTVVLGGIISDNNSRVVNKVPILGDIPILGNLFRSVDRKNTRTELVVFLTPHVVADKDDPDYIRAYERNRLKVDPLRNLDAPFLRKLNISPEDLRHRRSGEEPQGSTAPGIPQAALSNVRRFIIPAKVDGGTGQLKAAAGEPALPELPDLSPAARPKTGPTGRKKPSEGGAGPPGGR